MKWYAPSVNNEWAKIMAPAKHIRLNTSKMNIDMKADGECKELLQGINELSKEYLDAQR